MFNDLKKALSFGGATTPEKRRTSTLMGRSRKETSEKRNNSQDPEDDNESHTSVVTHERKFCMAQQILATILENELLQRAFEFSVRCLNEKGKWRFQFFC